MKHIKKVFALLLAFVMTLGMTTTVFAAGDLTSDTTISVTDLTSGDKVTSYQIIEWVDGTGWAFTSQFAYNADTKPNGLTAADLTEILGTPSKPAVADDPATTDVDESQPAVAAVPGKITQAMANKIAALASGGTFETITSTTWSKSNPAPGLYMVIVVAKESGVVYNPAFVGADFVKSPDNNTTNTISINATYSDTAVAKKTKNITKKTVKEAEDTINAAKASMVGDIVSFDITTKIPVFLDSYKNPSFKLEDEISAGMELVVDADHKITVVYGDKTATYDGTTMVPGGTTTVTNDQTTTQVNNVTITKDSTVKYTVDFAKEYLDANDAVVDVTITYFAKVTNAATFNVNWDKNEVKVTYSNGPTTEKGVEKDVTNHYTFSIGASIIGKQDKKGYEAVKVGVDAEGNELTELTEVTLDNGDDITTAHALEGALFGLYTTEAAAKAGKLPAEAGNGLVVNKNYPNGAIFTTLSDGVITFTGLDAGTYYLKELDAPDGFIKDTAVHPVNITATYEVKNITESVDGMEVKYDTSILKDYTVTIDGKATKYEFKTDGETIVDPEIKDITTEEDRIKNTKGVELPSTGGIGTTLFYTIGTILVLGAGIVLVTKRRLDA